MQESYPVVGVTPVTQANTITSVGVVLTLHYNEITDKFPVCHLLLIVLKSKFDDANFEKEEIASFYLR